MPRVLKKFLNNKQREYNIYKVSTNIHINADYAAAVADPGVRWPLRLDPGVVAENARTIRLSCIRVVH